MIEVDDSDVGYKYQCNESLILKKSPMRHYIKDFHEVNKQQS